MKDSVMPIGVSYDAGLRHWKTVRMAALSKDATPGV